MTEEERDHAVKLAERVMDGDEWEPCHRCEGRGALYADGKMHYPSENAPTLPCEECGGGGHIIPHDTAETLAAAVLALAAELARHTLHWTHETPTVPGWYWRWRRKTPTWPEVVLIRDRLANRRGLWAKGIDGILTKIGAEATAWAGPIHEPMTRPRRHRQGVEV